MLQLQFNNPERKKESYWFLTWNVELYWNNAEPHLPQNKAYDSQEDVFARLRLMHSPQSKPFMQKLNFLKNSNKAPAQNTYTHTWSEREICLVYTYLICISQTNKKKVKCSCASIFALFQVQIKNARERCTRKSIHYLKKAYIIHSIEDIHC